MPSNTTSSVFFHYVYVLESFKDEERYIGYSNNLKKRLEEHKRGLSFSTKPRVPFKLIYFEGCLNEEDAKRREHYFKTTQAQYINFDNFQFRRLWRRSKLYYWARSEVFRLATSGIQTPQQKGVWRWKLIYWV